MNRTTLLDNHNRPISYVRIAVTDRCNLRCYYCMPAEGITYLPRKELLSFEEIILITSLLAEMGVSKVRITGGEPFLRKQLVDLLAGISAIPGIEEIHLTTNGILTTSYIPQLKEIGIKSVNLSIDTLDAERFFQITRRNELDKVLKCLYALLEADIPTKLNAVIMEGKNTEDILDMAELTREHPISVRFIEEMPFNGTGANYTNLLWNHKQIYQKLLSNYPALERLPQKPHETASYYQIPGYKGKVGIIAAFSRTFCGSCNRIRITAQGQLKTCLYDDGVLDLKQLIRTGASTENIRKALLQAFRTRPANGFEAEKNRKNALPVSESMSTIGG
ncbi:MAG: GTP 3',8-cyclase MoaA [Bacteroidota bacterium]